MTVINIKDYITKTDKLIKIIAPEGYIIKNNKTSTLHYKIFCPLQADTSIYSLCEVVNEEDINNKILQSKNKLAVYLEEHPLLSRAKYPEGRYYNVDSEHQSRIASQLLLYQGNMSLGLEYQLTWNDTGSVCENWTFKELFKLSNEINAYIKPLIKKQQEIEIKIKNAKTKEDLNEIKIDYDN